jgi:hypothetical protein
MYLRFNLFNLEIRNMHMKNYTFVVKIQPREVTSINKDMKNNKTGVLGEGDCVYFYVVQSNHFKRVPFFAGGHRTRDIL